MSKRSDSCFCGEPAGVRKQGMGATACACARLGVQEIGDEQKLVSVMAGIRRSRATGLAGEMGVLSERKCKCGESVEAVCNR